MNHGYYMLQVSWFTCLTCFAVCPQAIKAAAERKAKVEAAQVSEMDRLPSRNLLQWWPLFGKSAKFDRFMLFCSRSDHAIMAEHVIHAGICGRQAVVTAPSPYTCRP